MMRLILASGSPRRRELLERIGADFEIILPTCDELTEPGLSPEALVRTLSERKANDVLSRIKDDAIVIAADTVVALDNNILGKPKNAGDACRMLASLSGKAHQVYTGLSVIGQKEGKITRSVDAVCTDILFYPMNKEQIDHYVATGEPLDKAGAYGIQGIGGLFVKEIHGDYYNVVGLPIAKLRETLEKTFSYRLF